MRIVLLFNSNIFQIDQLSTAGHNSLEIQQSGMLQHSWFVEFHTGFENLEK